MRKRFLLVLAFCLLTLQGGAASLQQAEQLYREGNFAEALSAYESALHTYPADPYLYYNIGNCYFKIGSRGLAIANYYRAFKLNPRDKDIRHNLMLALRESGEVLTTQDLPEALHKLFFWFTTEELKGWTFLTFWLSCALGALWLCKRRLGMAAGIALGLFALTGAWYLWRASIDSQPLAVVASPVAELRSGPGANFPASATISQGHLVLLEDNKGHWQEVVLKSQGLKGWVEESTLEKI